MKIKLLNENATVPTRAHHNDAGWDLYAAEDYWLSPGERYAFGTGVAVEIPEGYFGLVRPRSGLAKNEGVILCSSGVIDAGYRGELFVVLVNTNPQEFTTFEDYDGRQHLTDNSSSVYIHAGDRIAQLILIPYNNEELEVVEELSNSVRGTGGFGSSGK